MLGTQDLSTPCQNTTSHFQSQCLVTSLHILGPGATKEYTARMCTICWIIEKARELQKNIYLCFIDYAKAFDYVNHNKLWKILQETEIPDHLTCLLRNLYVGQEATVRTGHQTIDWFKIGKGVR